MVRKEIKVGVIGCGVVGGTILKGFKTLGFETTGYDKYKEEYKNNFDKVLETDMMFLCLPTVAKDEEWNMDMSPFEETFEKINNKGYEGMIIIKSTVIPGTTNNYAKKYPNLNIYHSPEFLTENNAVVDFFKPDKIILGIPKNYPHNVLKGETSMEEVKKEKCFKEMFEELHKKLGTVDYTDSNTSEFHKFMSNCFFATKVSFANEMNEIAKFYDANYGQAKGLLYKDERVGPDHLSINEERGYSGMCLPKDVNQLLADLKNKRIIASHLSKTREINDRDKKLVKL